MSPEGRSLLNAIRSPGMSNPLAPINRHACLRLTGSEKGSDERDVGWVTVKSRIRRLFKTVAEVGSLSGRCKKEGQGSVCCRCHGCHPCPIPQALLTTWLMPCPLDVGSIFPPLESRNKLMTAPTPGGRWKWCHATSEARS